MIKMNKIHTPLINRIIHSFNPKPFKTMGDAIYALNNKDLAPGEIALAYYKNESVSKGIDSIIATGGLNGSNQIYKNTTYIDKVFSETKKIADKNTVDIRIIELNVNDNIADIAILNSSINNLENLKETVNSIINDVSMLKIQINRLAANMSNAIYKTNDISEQLETLEKYHTELEDDLNNIVTSLEELYDTELNDLQEYLKTK